MPLYEYQCDQCSHRFELIQKFSDPPADTCPKCGGSVHKLLSSPAIQFKGSGWYITDYARAGQKEGGSSSSGTESQPGSADASTSKPTSEAKAEPKAEPKAKGTGKPSASAPKSE